MTAAGGVTGRGGPAGPLRVVFEDNHLLVVVKPAGLLAQADRTGDPDVLTLAKAYVKQAYAKPGDVYLGLVHRLDRPVSGLMVLARTSKAAARLSAGFRERTVSKDYFALVEGRLTGAGTRVDWLRKRDEHVEIVAETAEGAQRAALGWEAVAHDGARTLVAVALETGRPHQIRVQLAALGHPIAGDRRYGGRAPWRPGAIALHSYRLAVEHPTQRVPVVFTAEPVGWPPAFARAIRAWLDAPGGA